MMNNIDPVASVSHLYRTSKLTQKSHERGMRKALFIVDPIWYPKRRVVGISDGFPLT